ncbi:carbonic anhydrase [Deinococcus cellulosilyticus]|uniref:Carbonic anhydrase n=1 Tax=Deinococcus cellulosilyticus (strain DSM 18568 / NBRC 106333 / KACC 11606 / 5516J-15) TaxID=1223518 RepID=A0A511MYI6_DEIC1|nr:carbonic anhydrase [Deinococcus cellulosilyticus]GEM45655.1 carbonic anhydrase [Deinococcus cellulosilyticus NBRC 106333 = KACC 11606]
MKNVQHSRRNFLRLAAGATLAASTLGLPRMALAAPFAPDKPATPDAALKELLDGNLRYIRGRLRHPDQRPGRIAEVAKGQHPFAVILGCADSRVPPEVVFDQGLGNLFVVRVAGNIASDDVMGSIEYAVEELNVPLVMVLGHARCGAVTATLNAMDQGATVPAHISSLVEAIKPVAQQVSRDTPDRVDVVVRKNALHAADQLRHESEILHEKLSSGTLKIVSARYNLDDGRVELIG